MDSTFVHTGILSPKDCCLNLYLQAVPLADALKLDILRDRLAVYGSGETAVWASARLRARQIVECSTFFQPDWRVLDLIDVGWTEVHGVHDLDPMSGFYDPALGMLDLHPENNVGHLDNQPLLKAAAVVAADKQPLLLALRDWNSAVKTFWSPDRHGRLESLFHAFRATEVLASIKRGGTPIAYDESAINRWGKKYSRKVRHGDWDDPSLVRLATGDAAADRASLWKVLTGNYGPRTMILDFLVACALPVP